MVTRLPSRNHNLIQFALVESLLDPEVSKCQKGGVLLRETKARAYKRIARNVLQRKVVHAADKAEKLAAFLKSPYDPWTEARFDTVYEFLKKRPK